jgi:hypothetical protein
MPAAARKKPPVIVEAAPPADDDPRGKLAAAITAKQKADDAVAAKLETVRRSRDQINLAEVNIEKCRKAIEKGKEADSKSAATMLDRGGSPHAPWHTRQAIGALETAETSFEVAVAAQERLKGELGLLEDDVSEAQNGVVVAIKELTLPLAKELMAELRETRRRIAICCRVLSELLADDAKIGFHDQMRNFRACDARAAVFAEIKNEAGRLLYGASNEDHEAALEISKLVKVALQEMRMNAAHPLPKVE